MVFEEFALVLFWIVKCDGSLRLDIVDLKPAERLENLVVTW